MLKKENIKDIYPLSPMQEGMYFHARYEKKSTAYFEQFSYRIKADLKIPQVEKSLNDLLKRYDVLRTVYIEKAGHRPLQVVLKERPIDFYYGDITRKENKEDYIAQYLRKDRENTFDLARDMLMRVSVLKTGSSEYEFIWSHHHIVMDGWCKEILIAEYLEIYNSNLENRQPRLQPVRPYSDYIRWLEKRDRETAAKYWQKYLETYDETAELPGINTNPETGGTDQKDYEYEKATLPLTSETTARLDSLAKRNQVTLSTVIQALWAILLARYTGKPDVVFGIVVSGRPAEIDGIETMVGLFINTIPVRITYTEETAFTQKLREVREGAIQREPHHYYPLGEIQNRTPLKRELLNHILVFDNFPIAQRLTEEGAVMQLSKVETYEQSNFDFSVLVFPGEALTIRFDYNGNQYDGETVKRTGNHLETLVRQVLDNEDITIGEMTILTEEEKKQILEEFNETRREYPQDKTLHQLFREQAEKTPQQTAVIGMGEPRQLSLRLTYSQLDQITGNMAVQLRNRGVTKGSIVAIKVERSVEMIAGIIAILKAGAAYLPIAITTPPERMEYLLKDSNPHALLTRGEYTGKKTAVVTEINLDDTELYRQVDGGSEPLNSTGTHREETDSGEAREPAYVIYTSGSTGAPKGTIIEHHSAVNRLNWMQRKYPIDDTDVILQKTPYVFDVSVWELFWWSITGAPVCLLAEGDEKRPDKIIEAIWKSNVTTMHFVPSMLNAFLDYLDHPAAGETDEIDKLKTLKQVFASGEALPLSHVNTFNRILNKTNGTRLINLYGPTEATVDVSYYDCPTGDNLENIPIPIGKPIDNIKLYVVDKNLKLQPVGVRGELCISGVGLARGYLARPRMTAEKFVPDPYNPGERLYKTGDNTRWC
ncbi:MAG: amino acid adenylation domain-containing protein, partial [bacterium]|nr:amino acid adenylation domain-containing protein [bacterium]